MNDKKYRVKMIHNDRIRWKYCHTLDRARILQSIMREGNFDSIIQEKIDGRYMELINSNSMP